MSETLRDLVVSLSLQTDNFTRNIKSVNKQIKEAESAFRLASAGVDNFDHTTAGISARLTMLQRKLKLQGDAVTQYRRALQAADDKILECTHRQQDYANRLTVARTAHAALKTQIQASVHQVRTMTNALGANDSATIAARANLDLLKEEYRRSAQNVRKLAGQNTALKKSAQNAADAYTQVNTNLKTQKRK